MCKDSFHGDFSMKKKLYEISHRSNKMWINHVENSEKQNFVVILVVD